MPQNVLEPCFLWLRYKESRHLFIGNVSESGNRFGLDRHLGGIELSFHGPLFCRGKSPTVRTDTAISIRGSIISITRLCFDSLEPNQWLVVAILCLPFVFGSILTWYSIHRRRHYDPAEERMPFRKSFPLAVFQFQISRTHSKGIGGIEFDERNASRLRRSSHDETHFDWILSSPKFVSFQFQIDIIGTWGVHFWETKMDQCHFAMASKSTNFMRIFRWPLAKNLPYKDEISRR